MRSVALLLRSLAMGCSLLAITGCFASKYPPTIPAGPRVGEPTSLTDAVRMPYGFEELAAKLRKTGLFKEVWEHLAHQLRPWLDALGSEPRFSPNNGTEPGAEE